MDAKTRATLTKEYKGYSKEELADSEAEEQSRKSGLVACAVVNARGVAESIRGVPGQLRL